MAARAPEPAGEKAGFRLGRRPVLDGVRAVAILAVLGVHFGRGPSFDWPRGGFLGVDIFFVLSGFLITTVLLEEHARRGSFSFRAFYARRALRLLPALALVVAVFLVYTATFAPASLVDDNLIAALATITYWTNWLYAEQWFDVAQTGLTHAWTLSIEEQFYILWPLALATALAFGRRRAALVTVAFGIAAVLVWRLVQIWGTGDGYGRMYFSFDSRADSLLVGCGLAVLLTSPSWHRGARRTVLRFALLPAVVLIVACLVFAEEEWLALYAGGFTLFAVAAAVVLYNLVTWRPPVLSPFLEWRPIVYVGRISYGLYLWHFPIYLALRDELARGWLTAAVGLSLTFLFAAASFKFVEQPFLRYKTRFERRGRSVPEAAANRRRSRSRLLAPPSLRIPRSGRPAPARPRGAPAGVEESARPAATRRRPSPSASAERARLSIWSVVRARKRRYVARMAATEGEGALTPRELEVLREASLGRTNAQVAATLGVTVHAVKFHLASVFRKLGVRNRTEAAVAYLSRSAAKDG